MLPMLPSSRIKAAIRLKQQEGFFVRSDFGVSFIGRSLFRATIALPPNVPVGPLTARVYLFKEGRSSGQYKSHVMLQREGVERYIHDIAMLLSVRLRRHDGVVGRSRAWRRRSRSAAGLDQSSLSSRGERGKGLRARASRPETIGAEQGLERDIENVQSSRVRAEGGHHETKAIADEAGAAQ